MSRLAGPLFDADAVERYLDATGLGTGPLQAHRIGHGVSNVTFLVERDGRRFVLRRPPPPPLPPSAHDVVREARIQLALERAGARVPHVLAVCEDESVLGVPFYVMEEVEGEVVRTRLPPALDTPAGRRRVGLEVVDALAEIHAVDWRAVGLDGFGKPTGYLERQLRRWAGQWEIVATRDLPLVTELGAWLEANRPESGPTTVVHGDYRLGNLMLGPDAPARVAAVLDWELAALGDPLADLGYLLATWSETGSHETVMELSPVSRGEGFPNRADLADRYVERTGRDIAALAWYETLALWKAAVFCEAIYGRCVRGERDDAWARSLEVGVPRLLEVAQERAAA